MTTPAQNLNVNLKPADILRDHGIFVKEILVVPSAVHCPICKNANKTLVLDLDPADGYWAYCMYCGFAGDMIELKAAAAGISVSAAATKLIDSVNPEQIESYIRVFVVPRNVLRELWSQIVHKYHPRKDLLERFGLWGNLERMLEHIGSLSGDALAALNDVFDSMALRQIDKRHNYLLMLCSRLRKKPSGALAFNEKHIVWLPLVGVSDPGLAMFDLLRPNGRAYAFDNPVSALQLQRKFAAMGSKPLQTVVYGEFTERWPEFVPDDLIFIPTADEEQAIALAASVETIEPEISVIGTRADEMDYPAPMVLGMIENAAEPWTVRAVNRLLGVQEDRAKLLLNEYKLSDTAKSRLLSACPVNKRDELEVLLHTDRMVLSAGDKLFVQSHGKIYVGKPGSTDMEPYSDVVVIPKLETVLGQKIYEVDLQFGMDGAARTVLAEKEFTWAKFESIALSSGLPAPSIRKASPKRLLELGLALYRPIKVARPNRVGWREDGVFAFPRFTVDEYGIQAGNPLFERCLRGNEPCANLQPDTEVDYLRLWNTPGGPIILGTALALARLIAEYLVEAKRGGKFLCAVRYSSRAAESFVVNCVKPILIAYGLQHVRLAGDGAKFAIEAESAHTVPIVVEEAYGPELSKWMARGADNAFVIADPLLADILRLNGARWLDVDHVAREDAVCREDVSGILPAVLESTFTNPKQNILDNLSILLEREAQDIVADKAVSIAVTLCAGLLSGQPRPDHLLDMVIRLLIAGHIKMAHVGAGDYAGAGIQYGVEDVLVKLDAVKRALRKAELPNAWVDTVKINAGKGLLSSRNATWRFGRKHWDDHYRRLIRTGSGQLRNHTPTGMDLDGPN